MNQVEILFVHILTKYCITHRAILKNKQISGGAFNCSNKQAAVYTFKTANLRKGGGEGKKPDSVQISADINQSNCSAHTFGIHIRD